MILKNKILCFCTALLLPISAIAKQPVEGGCEILVSSSVNPSIPFNVTVVKSPTYPGQWFAPTVSTEIVVPVNADISPGPNDYSQTVVQAIDGLGGSNDAVASFVIPAFTNLKFSTVNIYASVSEPLNKSKQTVTAYCQASTLLR